MTPSRYVCELAWLGGTEPVPDVLVEIRDGRFAKVAPLAGGPAPADAARLGGLTLPGFANVHSHAFHRLLRGRTQGGPGSFWTWREQMYAAAASLTPDTYGELARAVFGEMVLAGFTSVGEFHYLHHGTDGRPGADPNEMGAALVEAARAAGVRITLLDACYLRSGLGAGAAPLDAVQRRFADADAAAWADRVEALLDLERDDVRIGAAIHSVRALDEAAITEVAAWARRHDAPLHAHVSEQPAENEQCRRVHGCSPLALLHRRGALSERFTAVHLTHPEPGDVELLGSRGGNACLCPTTERDLADGIGPAAVIRDAGAHVVVGSDSHAVIDPFEELRAVELDERLASFTRGHHSAASLLTAGTVAGHRALGWDDAGRIAVGGRADLVTVGLSSPRLAGTRAVDGLAAVVFAASSADVQHVVVDGRRIVADGRHLGFDVAAALARTVGAR